MTGILDKQDEGKTQGRRLCVLQVLPSLAVGGGGVERSALDVASALTAAGHKSLVASSGGPLAHELSRAGATHIQLPLAAKNPLTMYLNIGRLTRLIERHGVDIIHARSRAPAWSAMGAARRAGIRYLTTFHGTYNFTDGALGRLKHKYNSVMAKADMVIANSEFIAEHVRRNYPVDPARLRVIPRGIDLDRFDPDTLRADQVPKAAERWNLAETVPTIMLPGRLTRWKGQEILIDAVAQLPVRPLCCLLVGSDQGREGYRRRLEARIRARGVEDVVRIVGHSDDMPAAYMLADIVVSASTDPEAFGRVVAEAQAMGRPVIVSNHGGTVEQVIDGETGWLFGSGDAADLAEKLEAALRLDGPARDKLAARAISHVREHYGRDRMCAATLSVYEELIGR